MSNQAQISEGLQILDEFSTQLEVHEPKCYERIPCILDYLTYIDEKLDPETGKKVYERKRLRPIEKDLYRVLKQAAGDSICFKNTQTLAWQLNVSVGAIVSAKKVLSQSFEQLEGKSLISIEERQVPYRKEGKCLNKAIKHFITINHVWNFNNAFMTTYRKYKSFQNHYHKYYETKVLSDEEATEAIELIKTPGNVHNFDPSSNNELGSEGRSDTELAPGEAHSDSERNHNPYHNQTPYDNSYSRPDDRNIDQKEKNEIYDFMNRVNIFKKVQNDLIETFGWKHLLQRFKRYMSLDKKKIKNHGRYFIKIVHDLT